MALRRWLGLPKTTGPDESAAPGGQGASGPYGPGTAPPVSAASTAAGPGPAPVPGPTGDTQTVRAIVAQLDAMPRDQARYLAGFAYVLSRAAQADLSISDVETRRMEQIVVEHGKLPEAQAIIVVEIAKTRADLFGATEDYLVTREFRKIATDAQCLDLLRCCFLVGAADEHDHGRRERHAQLDRRGAAGGREGPDRAAGGVRRAVGGAPGDAAHDDLTRLR